MTAAGAWLILWGTAVGLDLVSVLQVMIARPLVAGTVAGVIVGDPLTGGMVGAALELFALDVLPVGGARVPDYGQGAVAATATAAGAPGVLGFGLAVAVGLAVAYLGQVGIQLVRRGNTGDVRRHREALDGGDARTVAALHYRGLARDVVRAAAVAALGLGLASAAYRWVHVSALGAVLLSVVLLGAGAGVGAAGALRLTGRGRQAGWFVLGLAAGAAVLVFR